MTMEETIDVTGLRKRFGRTVALDGMSFTVRPGQVTGFVGPNGAGKSTTMRVILGLDAPDAGQALVGGRRYQALRRPLALIGSLLDASALAVTGRHPRGRGRSRGRHPHPHAGHRAVRILPLAARPGPPARRHDPGTPAVASGPAARPVDHAGSQARRGFVRSIDYWLWGLDNGLTSDPVRCQRIASALAPAAQ
jgi:energy-coupling factor transporter ATP-binding protein EcfA2